MLEATFTDFDDEKWEKLTEVSIPHDISNYGRIRCLNKNNQLVLVKFRLNSGYPCVDLKSTEDKRKRLLLHQLVAKYFLEQPVSENVRVAHIDGNKTNNYYKNLSWVAVGNNAKKENTNNEDDDSVDVTEIKLTAEQISQIEYMLTNALPSSLVSKIFNISTTRISKIKKEMVARQPKTNNELNTIQTEVINLIHSLIE